MTADEQLAESVTIMSFGGGVQSTTLALLAIDRDQRLLDVTDGRTPDAYLFADTGDEPRAVYEHVRWMRQRIEASGALFRVVRHPTSRSLSQHVLTRARHGLGGISSPPFYVMTGDGRRGPVRRGCTRDFKVVPLQREVERLRGDAHVYSWIGISHDEMQRMKVSTDDWRTVHHPLVMMGWSRVDCRLYLESVGIDAPRSACTFCPFHRRAEWQRLHAEAPEDFAEAARFEREVRAVWKEHGLGGLRNEPSLHVSGVPIDEIDWDDYQKDLFSMDDECAGVCGV